MDERRVGFAWSVCAHTTFEDGPVDQYHKRQPCRRVEVTAVDPCRYTADNRSRQASRTCGSIYETIVAGTQPDRVCGCIEGRWVRFGDGTSWHRNHHAARFARVIFGHSLRSAACLCQ